MKLTVSIEEIPHAGKMLRGALPSEWMRESLLPAYAEREPLTVELELKRFNDVVHVEGRLATTLGFECSRTMAPGVEALDIEVAELYHPEARHELNLGEGVDADDIEREEPWTYEEGRIDLEPLIREKLVLAQRPYPTVAPAPESDAPIWTSRDDEIDPRWAKLKGLKVSQGPPAAPKDTGDPPDRGRGGRDGRSTA